MDQIEIKEEPIDYEDVSPEVQIQIGNSKDINLNRIIKNEPVDDVADGIGGLAGFPTLVNKDIPKNAQNKPDDENDEVTFMELLDILSTQQRKRLNSLNENSFKCVFNCGATFADWNECSLHEIEEAKRYYQNGRLSIKKRKKIQPPATSSPAQVPVKPFINLTPNIIKMEACLPSPELDQNVQIKQEIIDDADSDNNLGLGTLGDTSSNTNCDVSIKLEVKEEPMDIEEYGTDSIEKFEDKPVVDEIPKIKVPASLLNSLKAAQTAPMFNKHTNVFRSFRKINPPFELKKLPSNLKASIAQINPTTKNGPNTNTTVKTTQKRNAIEIKKITLPPKSATVDGAPKTNNAKIFKAFHKIEPPFELNNFTATFKPSTSSSMVNIQMEGNSKVSEQIPKTILQPITLSNTPFKIINPNMKILKLPPNIKIIKLEQKVSPEKPTAISSLPQIIQSDNIVQTPPNPQAETILKQAIIQENKKQKVINFVPKPTLDMIEQLPESKKAISDLLQKVKEAEARKLELSKDSENMMGGQSICTNVNLNSDDSNSSLSSVIENHFSSIYIDMNGDDTILFRMRRLYPHFRCFWICPYCPRQYALRNTLRSHLERLHQLGPKQLEVLLLEVKIFNLGGDISEIDNLAKSSSKELPEENLKSTETVSNTNATTKETHRESYDCTKCGRKCSSRMALRDHIAANCSREPQYQCSQCPKKFYSVSTLNCHVTIHTGELPHKCDYCDKRFRTRGQVTVHHRTHTGERPFKCQVCSQSFTHRETLIAHLSRHIGMKRYKCYACNKQFSCISGLRTHRDTRPETCGKVKFNPRALGPRVRVVKGNVIFEPQPEINPYLRSDSPPEVNSD